MPCPNMPYPLILLILLCVSPVIVDKPVLQLEPGRDSPVLEIGAEMTVIETLSEDLCSRLQPGPIGIRSQVSWAE